MEAHLRELQAVGHTLVPDAIPPQLLGRLQATFQRRVEATQQREPRDRWLQHSDPGSRENPHGVVELVRVCEEEPDFEALLFTPRLRRRPSRHGAGARGGAGDDAALHRAHLPPPAAANPRACAPGIPQRW